MKYLFYKETLQKTEPDEIAFDTVQFILNQLEEQNEKVWTHRIGKSNHMAISWKNKNTTSTIIVKDYYEN